jgi:predicted DNA-binding transcriptional regulator AlpA
MPKMSQHNTSATPSTTAPNLPIPGTYGTSAQLCTLYQVSRTTWWRWSQMPGFPRAVRFGRSVRWPVEAVEAFLTPQEA